MKLLQIALPALLAFPLAACASKKAPTRADEVPSTSPARPTDQVALPEVRYYVIADT